ncbi:MAG: hypothetical protein KAH17_02270 [Bacteroidales bacterium]|nr:hypothetical protein [Bacteroidales bacterium]
MRKHLLLTTSFLLLSVAFVFAQGEPEVATTEKSIDWFQTFITIGYLLGVFILLPIVIYSNLKEKLFVADSESQNDIQVIDNLSEAERNRLASQILDSIGEKLTPFKSEEGADMVTITKGGQAKFVKQGLDYINTRLVPTDSVMIDRVNEFSEVYRDRVKRVFTGSKWIIICSAGMGILFAVTGGVTTFLFIHILGLLFYILSSRTTMYTLKKRMDLFGSWGGGMAGALFSGLFIGAGAKHYKLYSDGSKERDYSSEFTGGAVYLLVILVVAMFLGVMAALLGVLNFFINYATSYQLPFKSIDNWYSKNF